MNRVSTTVEKNIRCIPATTAPSPITVKDSVALDVLPTIVGVNKEYSGRYIQNVGAKDCYYAFSADASPTYYNGILGANPNYPTNAGGQQLDVSNFSGRVSVYAIGGTLIAVTLLVRDDLNQGGGGIINPVQP